MAPPHDIETAVQRQWTNGALERPRSETPSTALKKLSDSRKQKPITIVLPKESDGKLDTQRDTPMPDIAEEKSQQSGQEADDELTDDDKKKRRRRHGHGQSGADKEASLLTMEEKKYAQQRPYSSFVRRTTPATGGEVQRPKTAHVKFQSEDLQSAFEEALDRFHKLHGDGNKTEQEKEHLLHKNDGTEFEYNWQERIIERHMLLRMQKILRSRSAAMRRKAWEEQLEEKRQKLYQGSKEADSQSAVAMTTRSDSCMYVLNQVERANTFLTAPVPSESRQSVRLPRRPKTAAANLQRQQLEKEVLKTEKPFRHKITQRLSSQQSSRTFSQSRDSELQIDPRILDPRNPYSLRPHTSKSIPSKCTRYVLISKPKHKSSVPLPTPLEEHLLAERFPHQGMKVYQHHTDLAAKAKKMNYTLEYTQFTHPIS
ncbi:hypothetical protein FSP39_020599 [Pinctada imbricata]|uniref:Uncharacterized protein n=1 Tax=Pinctada imbricata TaxID=66713 RepID=A0AA89CBC3_PINIB|nr:hypothetical protein FSP39_020599 [Pinctada imbricata]